MGAERKHKVGDRFNYAWSKDAWQGLTVSRITGEGSRSTYHAVDPLRGVGGFSEAMMVPAPLFAVGDKVRFTENNRDSGAAYGAKGDLAIITHIYTDGTREANVRLDKDGEEWHAHLDDLEPGPVAETVAASNDNGGNGGTLVIHEGHYYKTRDGRKVGPAVVSDGRSIDRDGNAEAFYVGGMGLYSRGGIWLTGHNISDNDIIAEWPAEDHDPASTAGFTVPLEAPEFADKNEEPDATLTTKITVDFSDFDAELDRIFARLRKLRRKSKKLGIKIESSGLQEAA